MVTTAVTVIEIDDRDDVVRLVEELETEHAPVILRHDGRDVALITPLGRRRPAEAPLLWKEITEEDRAASRAALGGWAGNVDVDRLRAALRESRELQSRPPVKLDL